MPLTQRRKLTARIHALEQARIYMGFWKAHIYGKTRFRFWYVCVERTHEEKIVIYMG